LRGEYEAQDENGACAAPRAGLVNAHQCIAHRD